MPTSAGASENVGVKLNSKIQLEAARAAGHSETFEKRAFMQVANAGTLAEPVSLALNAAWVWHPLKCIGFTQS